MSLVVDLNIEPSQKRKRGRRSKTNPMEGVPTASLLVSENINNTDNHFINNVEALFEEYDEPTMKKRGRKPKGGKLIVKQITDEIEKPTITNVILHLKCSLSDLNEYNNKINKLVTNPIQYNPDVPPDIQAYNSLKPDNYDMFNLLSLSQTDLHNGHSNIPLNNGIINDIPQNHTNSSIGDNDVDTKDANIREINSKLKKLKIDLYKNNNQDKKSACFWCTCDFDNPPCYIIKYEMDNVLSAYGCFCRPECAVAYLMEENIDDSVKFERYHLLNHTYGKAYGYKKNIKPAPNPYYLLDKYYGNLTIQEYRKMLKSDHILMTIEKPITRIMPELYEDTDENSIYGSVKTNLNSTSNTYRVKRANEKSIGPSKSSIIRDKFGLQ